MSILKCTKNLQRGRKLTLLPQAKEIGLNYRMFDAFEVGKTFGNKNDET